MRRFMSTAITLAFISFSFSATGSDNHGESFNNITENTETIEQKDQILGFNKHALSFGVATACYLFSASYDQSDSMSEACMNGVRATSLGIMTTYVLNFGGSIFKTCYDYALGKFDQQIFESIDKKVESRITQLDQVLEDRTQQLDDALEDRIKQVNESSFGGFLSTIIKGNSQGQ